MKREILYKVKSGMIDRDHMTKEILFRLWEKFDGEMHFLIEKSEVGDE